MYACVIESKNFRYVRSCRFVENFMHKVPYLLKMVVYQIVYVWKPGLHYFKIELYKIYSF